MRCGVLRADLVIVSKKKREMVLLRGESVLRTYRIALGREPVGPKRQEGDGRTPEGRYTIDWRNAKSKYHLSLHISYPDAADVARAREAEVDPGGDIMIHGLPDGVRKEGDWTQGCIAVTDKEMDEIWGLVEEGTPIWIRGMTERTQSMRLGLGFPGFVGIGSEGNIVVNEELIGFERQICRCHGATRVRGGQG
jgi:murein L,D-transpeptidase YafK